jgi:hypothetical protein
MKTTSRHPDRVRLQRRRRLARLLAAAPAALAAACTTADLARLPTAGDPGSTVQAPADDPAGTGNEEIAQSWRNY